MTQSLETIERRINALGLTEPTIQPRGGRNSNEILVQLPGEGDPTRAKAVIQAGGQLELKLVEDPVPYPSESAALAAHGAYSKNGQRGRRASTTAPRDIADTIALLVPESNLPAVGACRTGWRRDERLLRPDSSAAFQDQSG